MSNTLQQRIIEERERFFARVGALALEHANGATVEVQRVDEPAPASAALAWSPTLDCGKVKFAAAEKAIAKLNAEKFQGHDDWRLPEIRELLSLVDYTRTEPAIDVAAYPDTKSDWYWTGTPYAGVSGCAWIVYFGYGAASWYYRDSLAFVRAVRGPVARAGQ